MEEWESKTLVEFCSNGDFNIDDSLYENNGGNFDSIISCLQSHKYRMNIEIATVEFFRLRNGKSGLATSFGTEADLDSFKEKIDEISKNWEPFKVNMLEAIGLTQATGKRQTINTLDIIRNNKEGADE